MYFPEDYRWSHGVLIGLNAAPWGGAEIDEINRIGLRLKGKVGDDTAWFHEWAREAEGKKRESKKRVVMMEGGDGVGMVPVSVSRSGDCCDFDLLFILFLAAFATRKRRRRKSFAKSSSYWWPV